MSRRLSGSRRLAGKRMLVVEDSPTQAEGLRALLQAEGADVVLARDGNEGWSAFGSGDYDVVLSDILMPGMSGFELCGKIKADPAKARTPVVMLTSLSDPMDIIQGLEAGADNFLTKPYEPEYLIARIEGVISVREAAARDRVRLEIEISFMGKTFSITTAKQQILSLLISTFEEAVRRSKELEERQKELEQARIRLEEYARRLEGLVKVSDDKLGILLAGAHDAILTLDAGGRIVEINRRGESLFAGNRGSLIGRNLLEFIPGRDLAERRRDLARLISEGTLILDNVRGIRLDRRPVDIEISASTVNVEGETLVFCMIRDMTARIRAERRLIVQHEVTRVLASAASAEEAAMHVARAVCTAFGWDWGAFWALDRKSGGLRYLAGRHIPGRRLEGFLETSRSMVFPAGAGLPGKVMASGNPAWVADLAKTGEQCPRLSAALQAGLRSAIVLPVTTQGAFAGIFEFMHAESFEPDLELLGVLGAMASQLGQFLGRKRAEEERLAAEDQFRQSQKMEAIGRLAGGVAHDFNNLLTVISGYGELLLDQDAIAGEDREKLIAICHAAEKASALTRQLLAFSRREDVKLRPLDLNAVVSDTQKMLKRLIGEDIELVTAPDPALGKVMADPGQITQVIMNLAVNARDAMPKGGRLMIETANVELDEAYASEHGGVRAGEYVMLAVSDTGTGMDAETRARIFEPYFTTKAVGKGTGLGLATVYGAVRQLKGHVFVYSELGRGTSFKIYLPRLPRYAGPEEAGVQEPAPAAAPRTGTVLVVEDEAPVRGFTCEVLRAHGHAVLAAAGPEEAIALAAGPGSEIDLLLTDVIMPGMTGVELARRLIPSHPRMRVLLTSGYTEHSEAVQQGLGKALFIQKPFTPGALARKVSEALGGE